MKIEIGYNHSDNMELGKKIEKIEKDTNWTTHGPTPLLKNTSDISSTNNQEFSI